LVTVQPPSKDPLSPRGRGPGRGIKCGWGLNGYAHCGPGAPVVPAATFANAPPYDVVLTRQTDTLPCRLSGRYRNGVPVAFCIGRQIEFVDDIDPRGEWRLRHTPMRLQHPTAFHKLLNSLPIYRPPKPNLS
jgi:hypothetical protein